MPGIIAKQIRIEGLVQGVGFRPFIYRIATERNLCGTVLNDSQGVLIAIEGKAPIVATFLSAIESELPPLASISKMQVTDGTASGKSDFSIIESLLTSSRVAQIALDSHVYDFIL